METVDILKKVEELFNQEKFEEIIELLSDEYIKSNKKESEKSIIPELYLWKGNVRYEQKDYDSAINEYSKAIDLNPKYTLAFYNRAFAFIAKDDYDKALEDYEQVILLNPDYRVYAYVLKGAILRAKGDYSNAIKYYNEAIDIDPDYSNTYLNRGIARKESNLELEESKNDFKKFIELTHDKNDKWVRFAYAKIEEINEMNDVELTAIVNIISQIKTVLLIDEDCITHYTSLSALKSFIMDSSKFRLSEGNFMNDPSEGNEFFTFLGYESYNSDGGRFCSEIFSPKPFIGSFVTKDKHDDLNMWRFYGKENGAEAKGCAVTIDANKFIDDVNNSLPKGEEDFRKHVSDIHFYRVVYYDAASTTFHIPNLDNTDNLHTLMVELKNKVLSYKKDDKTSLGKYLNSIAFLFKSDAYKNENEVRLVVKGSEFEREFDKDKVPQRVYIELESIKNTIKKNYFGSKSRQRK